MNAGHDHRTHDHDTHYATRPDFTKSPSAGQPGASNSEDTHSGGMHGGHGWMMIACCIPMLVIAVALVATGVVSASFLIFAVACTAIMALMMRGMHGDGGHSHTPR
jgi:hypothetical protein